VLRVSPVAQKAQLIYKDTITKKKRLRYCQHTLACKFCKEKGHHFGMCLLRQTVPSGHERSPWVTALINSPKIEVGRYGAISRLAATTKLLTLGQDLNMGNPWAGSSDHRNVLRANLGLWKAIGAPSNVLSWLAYGLCLRFHHTPEHLSFPPLQLEREEQDFLEASARKYIDMGKYWVPPKGFPSLLSPQFVQHALRDDGTDKMRAVDHLQYLNAHLATH
jgi:hypothetical protein